ncbi:MAG: hypothetical protein ACJ78Q_16300 [Chloroflexia bacterium]
MARFQGNVHAGSDRAAATLLFLVLLIIALLALWNSTDPAGFSTTINNLGQTFSGGR